MITLKDYYKQQSFFIESSLSNTLKVVWEFAWMNKIKFKLKVGMSSFILPLSQRNLASSILHRFYQDYVTSRKIDKKYSGIRFNKNPPQLNWYTKVAHRSISLNHTFILLVLCSVVQHTGPSPSHKAYRTVAIWITTWGPHCLCIPRTNIITYY